MRHLRKMEDQMRPGAFSRAGFLDARESLTARLEADRATLERLGVTARQIADRIEGLLLRAEQHKALTGDLAPDIDGFRVYVNWFGGSQRCPWLVGPEGRYCPALHYSNRELEIFGPAGELHLPGLGIHLIRDHAFFEGNTPFRMDPEALVRVLGIVPGVDHGPRWVKESFWSFECRDEEPTLRLPYYPRSYTKGDRDCFDAPDERIDLAPGVSACLFDHHLLIVSEPIETRLEPMVLGGAWLRNPRCRRGVEHYHRCRGRRIVGSGPADG